MTANSLDQFTMGVKEVDDVIAQLRKYQDEIHEMYDTAFDLEIVQDAETEFENYISELKKSPSVERVVGCVRVLIDLLKAAERNFVYNPPKADFEAKCTLRDVWLAQGYSEEYIDEFAMGLLGKNKTLWLG